jgi:anti-sigma factor RsiW
MTRDKNLAALLRIHIHKQENPHRVGCHQMETLEAFLQGRLQDDVTDELSEHLTHCRECMMELKALRDIARTVRSKHRKQQTRVA